MKLIFDIETNGLLDKLDTIHSLVMKDADTGEVFSIHQQNPGDIEAGLKLLMAADLIVGHNVIKFDIPAIQKIHPWFQPKGVVRDTLILTRLMIPEIAKQDLVFVQSGKLPRNMTGRYSLAAFGHRLGEYKGDYDGGWEKWSPEMQRYCEQDIEVTHKLWNWCVERQTKHGFSDRSIELEHRVAEIVTRQERNGFGFDRTKAERLYVDLIARRSELDRELLQAFPAWEVRTPFIPKVNNKKMGYIKGEVFHKVKVVEFNPNSRIHIAERLKAKHGWEPREFTEDGKVKVDETVLSSLSYPEAKLLGEFLTLQKRIGQLSEGAEAWLRNEKNGRIHGEVITCGAVTGRMTHRRPNLAQCPSNNAPWGERCRELFVPRSGWVQVGCDADALELRCLASYMAAFDNGDYVKVVLEGDKAKGTDSHSVNARALGLDPKGEYPIDGRMVKGRDIAKTWFYAFIFGAGNWKLGFTRGYTGSEDNIAKKGGEDRRRFLKNLPALKNLTEKVQGKVKETGALKGIDGRKLFVRAYFSSVNTLLQSAGAIAMKQALVILDDDLQAAGLVPGRDYEFMGNIHDEWQIEAKPEVAELVGQTAVNAIRKAGDVLGFRCPLDGQYVIGRSWKDTH